MGKASISGQVQLDSLKEMCDVQDAIAAPLDHFEFTKKKRGQAKKKGDRQIILETCGGIG